MTIAVTETCMVRLSADTQLTLSFMCLDKTIKEKTQTKKSTQIFEILVHSKVMWDNQYCVEHCYNTHYYNNINNDYG